MLVCIDMKNNSKDIKSLLSKAEASLNETYKPQQVLAQIEATLSRKENQKVSEKIQKI
tara:strand:- start:348 stop:521 length:174 start_codon:yes stop_codon:yes gene_type:complete